MNKVELEKNCLDLSYKRYLQLLNIVLVSFLAAFFAFLGALILYPKNAFIYISLIIFVFLIGFIFYNRLDTKLKEISERIKNLC